MDLGILILAGSDSKRFGQNKAFYGINGKPMIKHVMNRVSKLSNEIVISCKSNREDFAEMFSFAEVIKDKWKIVGSLTGLVSTLPSMKSTYVAIITCDCLKVNPEIIKELAHRARNSDGAVPVWPNGYLEPLQAVYDRKKLIEVVEKAWKKREMKLTKILEMLPDLNYVSTEELKKIDPRLESFLNLNYIDDVQKIKKSPCVEKCHSKKV